MFTGLITDIGRIVSISRNDRGRTFTISTSYPTDDLVLGESIACNGACLTVTAIGRTTFDVDCSAETLARTTFATAHIGQQLHLERALRVGDRLGGHYVSGHVDAVGEVVRTVSSGGATETDLAAPKMIASLLVEKGSIAIDGVSLTVNTVHDTPDTVKFGVTIIPFTTKHTLLTHLKCGDKVNLETDLLGKYVQRLQQVHLEGEGTDGGVTIDKLREYGFTKS